MSQTLSLGPFRGLMAAMGGDAPLGFAGSLLNVRLGDGAVRPRYGYRNLAAAPPGLRSVHGLARVSGYAQSGDDSTHREEWVALEDRGSGVRPYAIDRTTFARTEITNGDVSLALAGGDWLGFSFNGSAYFVNPGGEPSVYRHEVGDVGSWLALQNSAYVDTGPDPTLNARTLAGFAERPWLASDAATIAGNMLTVPSAAVVDGRLEVHGYGNPAQDVRTSVVTIAPAAAADLSGSDYIALRVAGAEVVPSFNFGLRIEIKIAGVWTMPDQRDFKSAADTDVTTVARLRGVAGVSAVEAIRVTVKARPNPNSAGTAYAIYPVSLGGSYLGAPTGGARPWDGTYEAADVTYGVRYKTVGGTPRFTGIKSATLDAARFEGLSLAGSCPVGSRVEIEATSLNVAPWTRDEAGTAVRIEYLRKDADGEWRVLGDVPNADGSSWIDRRERWELPALPLAEDEDYADPIPPPVFSSVGFVAGVPYKGWVVWLRAGGKGNVQHSRVGDAERLYSPGDDEEDEARGQDFTLADDFADEPMGGVQAGDALLIAGREGVYGQAGNSPSTMTPTRKLPGAMGCAGRFAFARYRDEGGNYGMAWLDVPGESVWFAAAALSYSSDTQARPVELSLPIRGTVRSFLYEAQRERFPELSLSDARMEVDEATGSLWLVLGRRALVLRPPSPLDGQRQWEAHDYALGAGTGDVTVCADPFGPSAGSSETRAGQTLDPWSNPGAVSIGDAFASAGPFLPGARSRWLQAASFVPWTGLPAEAALSSMAFMITHRAIPANGIPTPVVLAEVQLFKSGTLLTSFTESESVPNEWNVFEVALDFETLGITLDDLNSGAISVRVAYDAVPNDPGAYETSNWSVDLGPPAPGARQPHAVSASHAFDVGATWLGDPIEAPPYVVVALTGHAVGGGTAHDLGGGDEAYDPWIGTVSANDGLGHTATGPIADPSDDLRVGDRREATGTAKRLVPIAGLVGSTAVEMDATATVSGVHGGTLDGFAAFGIEAVVVPPDASSVDVQAMALRVCYVVPQAESERSVSYLAFGPDRNLIWLRSSGHLDSVEWCPSCAHDVEGANRDGGLAMPPGHWETGRISGGLRRLARAEIEREGYGALALSAFTDRAPLGVSALAPRGQRWARWGVGLQGRAHRIRIVVDEATVGIRAMDLVFRPVAGPAR